MVRCVLGPVGLVLLGGGVSEGDLVVVVEPLLVVGAPAGVEDPLAKPLAHARQVLGVRLPSLGVGEVVDQVRVVPHEAVPQVQDLLDLTLEYVARHPQVPFVLLGEQNRPLEKVQILQGRGRPRYLLRTVTVPGDAPCRSPLTIAPFSRSRARSSGQFVRSPNYRMR